MNKVAINGLGRIGRATLKIIMENPELELVAINDIAPGDNLAYLLAYDTVYGRYHKTVHAAVNALVIDGREIPLFSEKDPAQLPWAKLGVDIVFECTGIFTTLEEMQKHIQAGARYALLSAPSKSKEMVTIVHSTSQQARPPVYSCASCTTNGITPVCEVMGRRLGVRKAAMSTVHAYTATQKIVDGPSKKLRRGRAGAANLVPSSTGAAAATTKVLPELEGKFDGVAIRVPVLCGSLADLTFVTERPTSVEEVNRIFKEESESERYRDVLGVTEDPLVSSDILRDSRATVVDLQMTKVIDGDLVKVMSWYDNEWGYAAQMVREAMGLAGSADKGG
ncbi:MAG: type I glyceraldehyde-3-phosphate dehydrogenase [Desulfurivibrionaceae bacterium]|nr:type I glyceraldehyde-3-phosphate dehydrogenase [Desulfurivibrionaceae bacterium]